MKKLEMNIQYSATGPAIFSFPNGAKHTVAKLDDIQEYDDVDYFDYGKYTKKKHYLQLVKPGFPLNNYIC